MKDLMAHLQIKINENIFLKDPASSELGKRILSHALQLIDEVGLESFTFNKLAKELKTTESSIYRYFESKHKLLIYLASWYWGWVQYEMVFKTANILSPEERLRLSIEVLARNMGAEEIVGGINLAVLNRIVISESSKAYLTKEVDEANKTGFYAGYKSLVARISKILLEIDPDFRYPHTLVSTIVEGIHHQKYFAIHLPSLSDVGHDARLLTDFYTELAISIIKNKA